MKALIKMLAFLCSLVFLVMTSQTAGICGEDEILGQSSSSLPVEKSRFSPALWLLSLYRDHISPVDADGCPSVPSCSSYAEQAFKKHGFFIGWMMTVDRLIHEGGEETSVSPFVHSDGEIKIFDPVENNDFWWTPRDRKHDE